MREGDVTNREPTLLDKLIVAMDCVDDLSNDRVKMRAELRGGCLIAIAEHVDGRKADYRMSLDTLEASAWEYAARDLFEMARSAL